MELGLKGKRALVVGASRGLGRGIAEGLAAEGCHVLLAARNVEKLGTIARDIRARCLVEAEAMELDLANPSSVDACCARALALGVDVLVNNSGGPPPSGALGVAADTWRRQFEIMVLGVISLTDRLVPPMRAQKWGRVLTIASSGVIQPIPTLGMSNTLRAGLVAWMKTLAGEVAADGVTVNVLLPGRIATERIAELDAAAAKRLGGDVDEISRQAASNIPIGRYGAVEEFASVAVFLASEKSSYVTGTMVRIDGGLVSSI